MLENDGEKVIAAEAANDLCSIGSYCTGIRVVDHQRLHGRTAHAGIAGRQRFAKADHVDRPHVRVEITAAERLLVEREVRARRELHPAAGTLPVALESRKAGD